MLVRDAEKGDLADMAGLSKMIREKSYEEIESSFYPRAIFANELLLYSQEILGKYIGTRDKFGMIAEEGGKIIGLAIGKLDLDTGVADLGWIGVAPDHRHRGIARALIEGACKKAKGAGCHKLIAYTMARLDSACAMYDRFGFIREAEMRRHWMKIDFVMYSRWLE